VKGQNTIIKFQTSSKVQNPMVKGSPWFGIYFLFCLDSAVLFVICFLSFEIY